MALEQGKVLRSMVAGEDLSCSDTTAYEPVKLDSSGNVVQCSGTTDVPFGILQNNPVTNEPASVAVSGLCKITLGATLSADDVVGCGLSGAVIGIASTAYPLGQLQKGGASGEVGTINLKPASNPRA